jgi:GTP-binding protein HflX
LEKGKITYEKFIIVGLFATQKNLGIRSTDETLDELEALVNTAGGEVAARVLQNRPAPDPATFIGDGKVAEVAEAVKNFEADAVVFDNDLSPMQMKNLEEKLDCAVLDRTGVILDIFASRARSAEGKLQVELAQYRYLLPRLIGQGKNLSRQTASGGSSPIGTRGPGETKLETDRRHIRERIAKIEEELESVMRVRGEQRRMRDKKGAQTVALVGYTNSGKSTLLNTLTGAGIHTANRLFDTLDPTTRVLKLKENTEVLLTDTVGFIRNLPHQLVNAFRATLEELAYADLVLHVVDISNPRYEEQIAVTDALIEQLCEPGTPGIYVFNKIDLCENAVFHGGGNDRVFISAKSGVNTDKLLDMIYEKLVKDQRLIMLTIPYDKAAVLEKLYREAVVYKTEYTGSGIVVTGKCGEKLLGQIKKLTETPFQGGEKT